MNLLQKYVCSLQQTTRKFRQKKSNAFKFGTAEKKLLVVLCYYVILAAVALTTFSIGTRDIKTFVQSVQNYFLCEQNGHDPDRPCNRKLKGQLHPALFTITYVLLGLFPVVHLIYAINMKELKDIVLKVGTHIKKKTRNIFDTPRK